MRFSQRSLLVLLTLALLLAPTTLSAQPDAINVVGSGITMPLLESLFTEAGADLEFNANSTGTIAGFEAFCNAEADIVTGTRAMSLQEEGNCKSNEIEFSEILLGYEAIAYITNPDLDVKACFAVNELTDLLSPTAAQYTTWEALFPPAQTTDTQETGEGTAINVFLPPSNSYSYVILDGTINGVGFRADATTLESDTEIIEAVSETTGGFGVVSINNLNETDPVKVLDIRNPFISRCITPSAETISDGSYIAGSPMLAYINAAIINDNEPLSETLEFIASEAASEVITLAGFTAPTEFDLTNNQEALFEIGRQFSRELTAFQIPSTVAGNVNIGGAAGIYNLINETTTAFTTQYTTTTINVQLQGEPAGLRSLCNGEIEIVLTYDDMPEETINNCAAADIELYDVVIGSQATVLVANEATDYLSCLTTEQITTTWQASSAGTVNNWQDVDASFADQDFILFAGDIGNQIANLMILDAAGNNVPLRADTETNADPLYRAAATANVEGALTYMSWAQYQDVLANNQERIQLVSVDDGEGCIEPNKETIANGDYPIARTIHLAVNKTTLERIDVQSFLWFLFSNDRLASFERQNLDTVTLSNLETIREDLQTAFEEADATEAARLAIEATATEEPVVTEEAESNND